MGGQAHVGLEGRVREDLLQKLEQQASTRTHKHATRTHTSTHARTQARTHKIMLASFGVLPRECACSCSRFGMRDIAMLDRAVCCAKGSGAHAAA